MKIEKVSIDSIKVYPNNAKIHTAEQIEEIKKSIQEFGNNDPIAIDEKVKNGCKQVQICMVEIKHEVQNLL